jgi:hypothetical protein
MAELLGTPLVFMVTIVAGQSIARRLPVPVFSSFCSKQKGLVIGE